MTGRLGCMFVALLKMVLVFDIMCLGGFADVREHADVSAQSSWIYGILHLRAKNIACVSEDIREMLFLYRSC